MEININKDMKISVDEDWLETLLEKKILCFMRRVEIAISLHECDSILDLKAENIIGRFNCEADDCHLCCGIGDKEKDCAICFPKNKSESIIKKLIKEMEPSPTAKEASEKTVKAVLCEINKILEQPREKVTFLELNSLLAAFAEDYHRARAKGADLGLLQFILENSKAEKLLRQKLEYLVSLQEK